MQAADIHIQMKSPPQGEARDVLTAALSFRRLRSAVVVDDDIDIFNDSAVLWAMATRVQWHRDQILIDGLTHPSLDPSRPMGASTVTKCGIDATLPPAAGSHLPRPCLPVLAAGKEFETKARDVLQRAASAKVP